MEENKCRNGFHRIDNKWPGMVRGVYLDSLEPIICQCMRARLEWMTKYFKLKDNPPPKLLELGYTLRGAMKKEMEEVLAIAEPPASPALTGWPEDKPMHFDTPRGVICPGCEKENEHPLLKRSRERKEGK